MRKDKIIVRPHSSNFWWGIYGFCEQTSWEDVSIFYENNERIGGICINSKSYLRAGLIDLKNDPDEIEFVKAIENYLGDNKCHYWYYYENKVNNDFYEVPYLAPINKHGAKPSFMDIWHPDERIGIFSVETGIKTWAKEHLEINECEIVIENIESLEDSLKSFQEHEKFFNGESKIEIMFSDDLIEELCHLWKKNKDNVLKVLQNSIK